MDPLDADTLDAPPTGIMQQRLLAVIIGVSVLVVVGLLVAQTGITGTAGPATPKTAVRGSATGVLVLAPGDRPVRVASSQPVAGATPRRSASATGWAVPADGSVVRAIGITSRAAVQVDGRRSVSRSDVRRIEIFGGRVVITGASMRASSRITAGRASGSVGLAAGATLQVDGVEQELTPNRQIAVPGIGTVSLDEQAVLANVPDGDGRSGPRHRVTGAAVHVRLAAPLGGLAAGTDVVVGHVESSVRQGRVKPVTRDEWRAPQPPATPTASLTAPAPAAPTGSSGGAFSPQTGTPKPGESSLPRRSSAVRGQAAGTQSGNLQGYVFPVLSPKASYTNDYGAFRATVSIGHQGNDIFAPEGTPIVAVADGILDRVGWNSIGGYRFWLFDQYGNAFYHAHLSAFVPAAVDGARVKAGDVIGFVGHTGDAQGTPDHLHFEVHPGNGSPTNPFPLLNAWRRGVPVAAPPGASGASGIPAITLLAISDISPNSGLQPSVLDRVPDTRRPITEENAPSGSSDTLGDAIDGAGITRSP